MGDDGGVIEVVYCDTLLIRDLEKLKQILLQSFDGPVGVVLDFPEAGAADFAAIQFLESARRYAVKSKRQFRLARPAAGTLADLLERGGFLEDRPIDELKFWQDAEIADDRFHSRG